VGSNGDGTRLFWTVPIDDSDVSVQFGAGKAEMRVNNLALDDYHFLANAIGPNFDNPATQDDAVVSFDVVWSTPITRRIGVTNGTLGNNYTGNYVENQVTVTWSGTNLATGFSFTSNPGTFATSFFDGGFAELAQEQNGIFDTSDSSATDSAVARSLAQTMPAKPLQVAVAAAVSASLPSAGQATTPVVTVFHGNGSSLGPDPGGSYSTDSSDQLVDALFR
jgi:hypothetical protein